jgi:hypothetical protein
VLCNICLCLLVGLRNHVLGLRLFLCHEYSPSLA